MAGVFAAGNVLHVHDLVDFVSAESGACRCRRGALADGRESRGNQTAGTSAGSDPLCCAAGRSPFLQRKMSVSFSGSGEVVDKAAVIVENGGKILYKGMRPRLLPGEMESVTIKADALAETEGGQLTVRLEKR